MNRLPVNIDIISGSYINGSIQNAIYTFFPDVSLGYQMIKVPKILVYFFLALDTIRSIGAYRIDQDGHLVNLRGENLTMRFHYQEF